MEDGAGRDQGGGGDRIAGTRSSSFRGRQRQRRRRRRCAATWDASRRNTQEESVEIMARGATMMDAKKMFMLEESAKGIIS
jgi:hypothetical protein